MSKLGDGCLTIGLLLILVILALLLGVFIREISEHLELYQEARDYQQTKNAPLTVPVPDYDWDALPTTIPIFP